MKNMSYTISKIELVKMEKSFSNRTIKYIYNLWLEGIEEPMIFEYDDQVKEDLVGKKITYKISDENIVTDFEVL